MKKSLKIRQKGEGGGGSAGIAHPVLEVEVGARLDQRLDNRGVANGGCQDESRLAVLWPRTSRGAAPGGAHETVSPRPENRHTAPGALPLPEEPGPLLVGARLGTLWGGACFLALKRPFPPSRPSTRPQLGATALEFHKICTTRSATRAPWRPQQPWATFSC